MSPQSPAPSYLLAGRLVNRIGFGAMRLPGPGVFGPPTDRRAALAVLRRALELGVNHIDTAAYYGPEVANALIREALWPYPAELTIVTKVGGARDARGRWLMAQRPDLLRQGVEDDLRSLGLDRVDVVNLRLGDDGEVPLDDQLAELVALRDAGKIGAIGLSNVTLAALRDATQSMSIACVQNAYSLVDRSDEATRAYCAAENIPYVPFFPLGGGASGRPAVARLPEVVRVAARAGASPAQVGLAWLLARGPNTLLIPGTSSVPHLEENMAAATVELTADDGHDLDVIR